MQEVVVAGRPWDVDLSFKDSNHADVIRCCGAYSRMPGSSTLWDDQKTWAAASTAVSRYAKGDTMMAQLVTRQTPKHNGRALTSMAEFDHLMAGG